MPKKILVPLDGSTFSEHALPVAAKLAREAGAELYLIQVHETAIGGIYPNGVPAFDTRWNAELRLQEQEYLRAAAGRCMAREGVSARTDLLDGVAPVAIARFATELDIDLIVMTTHGRGGISRAWIGSVADALVRRGGAPVMLIRPHHDELVWDAAAPMHNVLIPLDGSELSETILEHAIAIGELTHATYTLLRVVLPVPYFAPTVTAAPFFVDAMTPETAEQATAYLERVAGTLRARGFHVGTATVVHSMPAAAILDYAATHAIDSIAMATHGRGGWSRLALGSVADSVMRGSLLPILLYREAPVKVAAEQLAAKDVGVGK